MLVSDTKTRLTEIMDERGLTQADVLKLCEKYFKEFDTSLSKMSISNYCSGKSLPNRKKTFILAKALNVDPAWLMGYDLARDGKKVQEKPDEMRNELLNAFEKMDMREKVDLLSYAYDILEKRKG